MLEVFPRVYRNHRKRDRQREIAMDNKHYHLTSPSRRLAQGRHVPCRERSGSLPFRLNRCAKGLIIASAAVLTMLGIAASAAPAKQPKMVPTPSVKPTSAKNSNTSAPQADDFQKFLESMWPRADAA